MRPSRPDAVRSLYRHLYQAWGRQHWWPAESPFEVILGAYLTQNTAWTNVEKALASLRRAGALSLDGIRRLPENELAELIRSSGYFRQKAARLKKFVKFLDRKYGGSLSRMFAQSPEQLRAELLELNGVGPETADSILLYAGHLPVFVVDAYTRRILDRHGILPAKAPYEEIRALFEAALSDPEFASACVSGKRPPTTENSLTTGDRPPATGGACHAPSKMSTAPRSATAQVYNEMHGLIVGVGKNYCLKSKALCDECPLGTLLTPAQRKKLK